MMDFVKAYAVDGDNSLLAFAIKNAFKDVGYYKTMAENLGQPSLMVQSTHDALKKSVDLGKGEHMVSELVEFLR